MRPCNGNPSEHPKHGWTPPKGQGKNIKEAIPGNGDDRVFRYNNGKTTLSTLPEGCTEYQTCSMYTCDAVFWLVMYDATQHKVDDGDDGDEGASPLYANDGRVRHAADESKPDWTKLHFEPVGAAEDKVSYATANRFTTRLLHQQEDDEWARQLLPHPHLSDRCDDGPAKGGLVGDLSVLLALVGFTMKDEDIVANMPSLVREPCWDLPRAMEDQCPHGGCELSCNAIGCPKLTAGSGEDKRGLLVTVWRPAGQVDQGLKDYERGKHGKIFGK